MARVYKWLIKPSKRRPGRGKLHRDPPREGHAISDVFVDENDAKQLLAWRQEWERAKVKHNELHATEPTF